ncbi:MAG: hypothetical protein GEV28_28880 [Actinophytocola sp.]|uniref:hypothetical protein n=1 Tax=Actinophytocola sp. TaxID=1872138 RepID=UPI001328780C|nr:hypothetical protein [Actinophytocola sp.]MPZ84199.1 hypothetical protein [Actinophytocola sp.]
MSSNPPEKSVWLDIPEDCRMHGEFTGDGDVHVVFGDLNDGANVLFERLALERFVQLANELLRSRSRTTRRPIYRGSTPRPSEGP